MYSQKGLLSNKSFSVYTFYYLGLIQEIVSALFLCMLTQAGQTFVISFYFLIDEELPFPN